MHRCFRLPHGGRHQACGVRHISWHNGQSRNRGWPPQTPQRPHEHRLHQRQPVQQQCQQHLIHHPLCLRQHRPAQAESHPELRFDAACAPVHCIISFTACNYIFEFPTAAACPVEILECTVAGSDGSQYDLSGLSLSESSWGVFVSGDYYEINVCRPVPDSSCPPSSGVCLYAAFVMHRLHCASFNRRTLQLFEQLGPESRICHAAALVRCKRQSADRLSARRAVQQLDLPEWHRHCHHLRVWYQLAGAFWSTPSRFA